MTTSSCRRGERAAGDITETVTRENGRERGTKKKEERRDGRLYTAVKINMQVDLRRRTFLVNIFPRKRSNRVTPWRGMVEERDEASDKDTRWKEQHQAGWKEGRKRERAKQFSGWNFPTFSYLLHPGRSEVFIEDRYYTRCDRSE